jgi:hypothetical protein
VPADESFRLDHDQTLPPIEKPAQDSHKPASGVVGSTRFDSPLLKKRELPPEKEVLGGQSGPGSQDEKREQAKSGKNYPQRQ